MASFDSDDLLVQFNELAGRPTTDAITSAQKFARLARAQNTVVAKIANVAPYSLYPKVAYASMPTLTLSADGKSATFGTDDQGFPKFPMGRSGIYSSLNDIPDNPLREGVDYITEGYQIRALNNTTLPATLYWYGISQPKDINTGGSAEPALFPEASRRLIVIEAVRTFSQEYLRNAALADEMAAEWNRSWPTWCTVWKTQFRQGGALNVLTGRDLALGGQWAV